MLIRFLNIILRYLVLTSSLNKFYSARCMFLEIFKNRYYIVWNTYLIMVKIFTMLEKTIKHILVKTVSFPFK